LTDVSGIDPHTSKTLKTSSFGTDSKKTEIKDYSLNKHPPLVVVRQGI